MKKNEFDKMGLEALMKWSEDDANVEASSGTWNDWRYEVKQKAKKYFWNKSFSELEQFYNDHPHEDIPPWSDAWFEAVKGSWPFSEIFESMTAFETTLNVILKKIGHEDAGISINQLSRLKGGHAV